MLKIAICEDSEIFVEIIKKNIETILKVPYELHPFLSGREFMTSLPEMGCPYDIVFLDISLGDDTVSGIELGQMINGENPRTQLILASVSSATDSAIQLARPHLSAVAANAPTGLFSPGSA